VSGRAALAETLLHTPANRAHSSDEEQVSGLCDSGTPAPRLLIYHGLGQRCQ